MNSLRKVMKEQFTDAKMPSYLYTYPTKAAYKPFTDWEKACMSWKGVRGPVALYIHIPFCEMKCSFCDLFTVTHQPQDSINTYVDRLVKEMRIMQRFLQTDNTVIQSIYFGGGTPSLLSERQLFTILDTVRSIFTIANDAEVSIEGAPNSFSREKFAELARAGFNRISIGIQTFDPIELRTVGRNYCARLGLDMAIEAVESGIKNINLDLIYGIPGQDFNAWEKNLKLAVEIGPRTLTTYPLVVRNSTSFGKQSARGTLSDVADAALRYAWYDYNHQFLEQYGYKQHTLVTYAKEGGGCQHENREFLGAPTLSFGVGSRKYAPDFHYADEDYSNRKGHKATLLDYMDAVQRDGLLVRTAVQLSKNEQMLRFLILGLLSSGIDAGRFSERFHEPVEKRFGQLLKILADEGYLHNLCLTAKGMRYSSHIGHFIHTVYGDTYEMV